jgi:hypothetical protein
MVDYCIGEPSPFVELEVNRPFMAIQTPKELHYVASIKETATKGKKNLASSSYFIDMKDVGIDATDTFLNVNVQLEITGQGIFYACSRPMAGGERALTPKQEKIMLDNVCTQLRAYYEQGYNMDNKIVSLKGPDIQYNASVISK